MKKNWNNNNKYMKKYTKTNNIKDFNNKNKDKSNNSNKFIFFSKQSDTEISKSHPKHQTQKKMILVQSQIVSIKKIETIT